ncbi:hypothetical protein HMPREF9436_02234 [Faecalibacterium cf. prausnitzii KLE1255]|uniref:Uncharacterized protein n=1 Tax=Faecalibacterium cf. prausnitzii KLE1255 TaxID=748224 RepID=E2ZKN1_9FIRM|nr:hypothetical protein HMPREF9436_02234 [Faecalibacterium cf. prausnitzii KLE1255]
MNEKRSCSPISKGFLPLLARNGVDCKEKEAQSSLWTVLSLWIRN